MEIGSSCPKMQIHQIPQEVKKAMEAGIRNSFTANRKEVQSDIQQYIAQVCEEIDMDVEVVSIGDLVDMLQNAVQVGVESGRLAMRTEIDIDTVQSFVNAAADFIVRAEGKKLDWMDITIDEEFRKLRGALDPNKIGNIVLNQVSKSLGRR